MAETAFTGIVYWHWLALAGAFIGLEILAPGVFLIFLGIAAGIVGLTILALPSLDWRLQLLVFGILSVALVYIGRRIYGRMSTAEDHGGLNRRGDRLVGEVHPLASGGMTGGRGKLRVGDSDWLARLAEGADADHPEGAPMRVIAVEGATLIVTPRD